MLCIAINMHKLCAMLYRLGSPGGVEVGDGVVEGLVLTVGA